MKTVSMTQRAASFPPRGQRGIALATALILLIVVALVGMAAVRGTIMQQKMTSNFYDRQLAFQAAEAGLRQGESVVAASAGGIGSFRDCRSTSTIKCVANPFTDSTAAGATTTVSQSSFNPGALMGNGSATTNPQYIIEYLGNFTIPPPNVHQVSNCSGYGPCAPTTTADFYRITARSGPNNQQGRATVTLQTVFRR